MRMAGEGADGAEYSVLDQVAQWEGVSLLEGERGETSVRLGRVEIGHMHGPWVAHFGFPKPLWRELIAEGIVEEHPMEMEGWAERRIRTPEDVAEVVDLFRLNYERLLSRRTANRSGGNR